jgi:hypothetical protein
MANGWPRTSHARETDGRFHGKNHRLSVARTRNQLLEELRLLGASDVVLSSNVPTRSDGLLQSDPRRLDDPGIAVYFSSRGSKWSWRVTASSPWLGTSAHWR